MYTLQIIKHRSNYKKIRRYLLVFLSLFIIFIGIHQIILAKDYSNSVLIVNLEGPITPPMSKYVMRVLNDANESNAEAVFIKMDTPGGLDTSMREIVKGILDSHVPVINYVVPGGRAASAGIFIAMASHLSVMAPGSSIGAASPVSSQGQEIEGTLKDKVTNDAAEYIRDLANNRNRNGEWAANSAVRLAKSLGAQEALEKNVIDMIAEDFDSLKIKVDGRTINVRDGVSKTLSINSAIFIPKNMTFAEQLLFLLTNPNLAFLLLSLGSMGIFLEFSSPGSLLPGIVGGLCLLLGLYGVGTLEGNWVGVILLFLGFGLLITELFVSGFGVLGIGGIVSFLLGTFMLWDGEVKMQLVNHWFLWSVSGLVSITMAGLIFLIWHTNVMNTGKQGGAMIGKIGFAVSAIKSNGKIEVDGEYWNAFSEDGVDLGRGDKVVIIRAEGLRLAVRRVDNSISPDNSDQ